MDLKVNYSSGRKNKLLTKFKIPLLALAALLIIGIGPIIADQVTNNDSQNETVDTATVESSVSPSPVEESSATPSPTESPEPTVEAGDNLQQSDTESGTVKASPTPTKIPPHAVSNQEMLIQIPRVQRLDPRATQTKLPQVNFYAQGSPYLMLCMNSSRGIIDLEAKGIDDSFKGKEVFVYGDLTTSVQIAGTSSQVLNIFNSFGGLKLNGPNGRSVIGTNLYMRFVAISEPTDNFELCGESSSAAQWNLEIQPLGLQVNTKKNPVNMGNKTKNP